MLSDNHKVILWFAVCLALAIYAKTSGAIPSGLLKGEVLGQATTSQESPGFGPLLSKNK